MGYSLMTSAFLIIFTQAGPFAFKPELSSQAELFSTFVPNIVPGTRQDGLNAGMVLVQLQD